MNIGKLIVFEGIDKTGKTSVSKQVCNLINTELKRETIWTYQPGNIPYIGDLTRKLCKDKSLNLNNISRFFAFQLDRSEQIEKVITPALLSGKNVICDRWSYSTFAYQFFGEKIIDTYSSSSEIYKYIDMINFANHKMIPDKIVYFPEQLLVFRTEEENDYFNSQEDNYFERVLSGYEYLYHNSPNWEKIKPKETMEETAEYVFEILKTDLFKES